MVPVWHIGMMLYWRIFSTWFCSERLQRVAEAWCVARVRHRVDVRMQATDGILPQTIITRRLVFDSLHVAAP